MSSARSWSLIGGYTLASQPVTRWPASRASAARPPMKVPQMPRMWMCMEAKILGSGPSHQGRVCINEIQLSAQCFTRGLNGRSDVGRAVGGADEAGFVQRRCEVDPAVQHG